MEKKPFIGQMDRKIKLVKKILVQSNTGAEKSTDNVIVSPFAKMEDVSGDEDTEGKVRHLVNRVYTVRFNQLIKTNGTALVLVDENRKFEIIHISEIGRRQFLKIKVRQYE